MTFEEFRTLMNEFRAAVDREGEDEKDSYLALEALHTFCEKLEGSEKEFADRVLTEWLLSDDEGLRFDAEALIDDYCVIQALPALATLRERLAMDNSPGAPFEIEKLERISRNLQGLGD